MNNLKTLLSSVWEKLLIAAGVIGAILFWVLRLKQDKVDSLQAQVDEADTQKKADVAEAQIKEKMDDAALKEKQVNKLQQQVNQLDQQRKDLPNQKDLTPDQIQNFWNNNE